MFRLLDSVLQCRLLWPGCPFKWPSEDALADVGDPHYVSSQEASSFKWLSLRRRRRRQERYILEWVMSMESAQASAPVGGPGSKIKASGIRLVNTVINVN
jgi:hypothetical protein